MSASYNPANSQKARKRNNATKTPEHESTMISSEASPSFPLASLLWTTRGGVSPWLVVTLILMFTGLFRWTTGFWGYSGYKTPPMHGDFEAQRHWMEITKHLPISQWYFYDLQWWGLDYPPLTAYHSWLLGNIGSSFDRKWFELKESRALDDDSLKVYMRATVFISEYLIYVPALIMFLRRTSRSQNIARFDIYLAFAAILMQPATMLIDHGHFQYNTVMLGFVVAALSSFVAGGFLRGSVFFVASLCFKQMALYYAPGVFAYLLGICVFPRLDIGRFVAIATITVVAFGVAFAPLLLGAIYDAYWNIPVLKHDIPPLLTLVPIDSKSILYAPTLQLFQIIHRVFPFARGLFEDKVANFWCFVHTFHKLHQYSKPLLQQLSLAATAASIILPCLAIFLSPKQTALTLTLASTAWGFFLFSFQVHEKSVLLPLLPMTLMLGEPDGMQHRTRSWISWANILGSWTLFPLLKRDDLRIPYFVLTTLWGWLMGVPSLLVAPFSDKSANTFDMLSSLIHGLFYSVMICWHVLEAFVLPPEGKPDLWVVINVLIGTIGFGICYLWCLWSLLGPLWFGDLRTGKRSARSKSKAL